MQLEKVKRMLEEGRKKDAAAKQTEPEKKVSRTEKAKGKDALLLNVRTVANDTAGEVTEDKTIKEVRKRKVFDTISFTAIRGLGFHCLECRTR